MLEKITSFSENSKIDVSVPTPQIGPDYEAKRTDAWVRIEELNITKRLISTCEYTHPMGLQPAKLLFFSSQARSAASNGLWRQHAKP